MKTLLITSLVILCLTVRFVKCQEDESSGDGMFDKFKTMWKNFINSMRDIWNEFTSELKARSTDMRDWTREMFNSFKSKMKEWVEENSSASEKEKEDMRKYLEKMEMPENES